MVHEIEGVCGVSDTVTSMEVISVMGVSDVRRGGRFLTNVTR